MSLKESVSGFPTAPIIEKRRLEPVRRNLIVKHVQSLSSRMLRIVLQGDDLVGFNSPSPDDHIKLFFPTSNGEFEKKDYTPRHFDAESLSLTVDFALHTGGVGSDWAAKAKPGDHLQIGGPRGSTVISAPGAWWLLVGDETALPSAGRRIEEAAPGTRIISVMAVTGADVEQTFETKSNLAAHWIHRPDAQAADPQPILDFLSKLDLPTGPGFIWIAAEAAVARAVRTYVLETLGHPPEWVKASAYWSINPEEHE